MSQIARLRTLDCQKLDRSPAGRRRENGGSENRALAKLRRISGGMVGLNICRILLENRNG